MYLLVNNKRYTELNKQGKSIEIEFKSLIKQNNDLIATTVEDRSFTIGNANWENLSIEDGEFQTKVTKEELQQEINAKLLKDSASLQIELNKQKQLNANLLVKIAQMGGIKNV